MKQTRFANITRPAVIIVVTALLFLLGGLPAYPSSANDDLGEIPKDELLQVFKIDFSNNLNIAQIAYLDIWEIDHSTHTLIAALTPAQADELRRQGYTLTKVSLPEKSPGQVGIGFCYRPVDQLYVDLFSLASSHPGLISVQKIGLSYSQTDLWVAKITNQALIADKPRLFVLANVHGRELITPETAFAFMDTLLQNYGQDPDITALVDWQETYIMLTANPDGHKKTEQNIYPEGWRKNTQPYGACSSLTFGVDLNRNHSFGWGQGLGSSSYPCDLTYSGPAPASEPETQAIENFTRSIFQDQRGPTITDAAPITTTGMLISLHSYGNLILWPWGDRYDQAPNGYGLAALGSKMANFNQYTPTQAINLYPTDGTTDQWAYGELGIAAFTFEIGSNYDGFSPSCDRYHALIDPNVNALVYAARSSYLPFQAGPGPEVANFSVTAPETNHFILTADIDSASNPIQAAELYLDTPPWAAGNGVQIQAADGSFDTNSENINTSLAAVSQNSALTPGVHMIWLRAQTQNGYWGPFRTAFIHVEAKNFIPIIFGAVTP